MSLAKKYDERLRSNMKFRPVWPPGTNIRLGDVLLYQDDFFHPVASLGDFGVSFREEEALRMGGLRVNALGVKTSLFQAGAEVSLARLDLEASAEARIAFEGNDGYFLRTPDLTGVQIDRLLTVAGRVERVPDWNHGKYYIAHTIYHADEFLFLGSERRTREVKFSGLGRAVLSFLTLGLSAGLEKTSTHSLGVEIFGRGGPVAMGVAKIKRNGEIDFH